MKQQSGNHDHDQDSENPDLPPESFWVPSEQSLDWFNQNAFMERKGSTKLAVFGNINSDPKSNVHRFYGSPSPSPRVSLIPKSKSSIMALPKTRRSCFGDRILRRSFKTEKGRMVRSRSEPGMKHVGQVSEPGSPRVSCMGKVRDKKGRGKRPGLWESMMAIFVARFWVNRVVNGKGSPE